MSDGNSLINFGDVSKPVTVLIKKISNAIGVLYEPTQIRKVAKANADAAITQVKGQIEITDLQRRAMSRFITEEAKKQQNIEEITRLALPDVKDDAKSEQVSDDWIIDFFDKCRLISDKEMQQIWAKILAGEANSPGKFSKRTIGVIASLDKVDAQLFNSFCSFVWIIGSPTPLIFDIKSEVYTKTGLTYSKLLHLDDVGLVNFNTIGSFNGNITEQMLMVFYCGQPVLIELSPNSGHKMSFGSALLSKAGAELADVCGAKRNEEFFNFVVNSWRTQGHKVEIPQRFENV